MKVRVRLFAAAKQAAGRDSLEVEIPEQTTIGQLRRRLAVEVPQLSGLVGQVMFAINTEYAGDAERIPAGAEVAIIPPVSGG
jgi:molybdopterin converting factor subunit 1